MTIKIATCADIHIGVKTYGTIDPNTGLNTREINVLESLDNMIDYCINDNINYMIVAGDVYKNNLPTPTLQKEFNSRMQRAENNNIKIYIMSGNHDVSPVITAKSPLDPFDTLQVNNIYHSRFVTEHYINDDLRLLILPTYCNQAEIEGILDEYKKDIPTIIVGHATILGAKLNDWLLEKNEDAIDSTIFEKPWIIAAVFGHLHKHQILNTCPLTYYTGSLQRIDFTEENQEKGFVVLEVDGKKVNHKFIEIQSQKFHTIKLDLTDIDDAMSYLEKKLKDDKDKITNSIFRLIVDVNKNNNINDTILIKQLRDYNVCSIASIQKNIDRNESVRNKDIDETITEEKALEIYLKDNENKDEIMKIGLEMIKKLQNNSIL